MRGLLIATWLAATLLVGCQAPAPCACEPEQVVQSAPAPEVVEVVAYAPPAPPPGLLFDRRPGGYRASDFVGRSDWPSSAGTWSPGEVTVYRERFVDFHGRGFQSGNDFYRRAESYRTRVGFRR